METEIVDQETLMSWVYNYNSPNIDNLPARYEKASFWNFQVEKSIEELINICTSIENNESITLTGNTGTGKTHLAISIMKNSDPIPISGSIVDKRKKELESRLTKEFRSPNRVHIERKLQSESFRYRPTRCLFKSAVEFFMEAQEASINGTGRLKYFKELVSPPKIDNERSELTVVGYDILCLDDLGAEKMSDFKRESLYYLIDERYKNNLSIIITSNFTIQQLDELEPRIASRLQEMGKILYFRGQDYRLKIAS